MKKILVISSVPVYELNSGNRKCIHDYCELLRELGADVSYLLLSNHHTNKKDIEQTQKYFGNDHFFLQKSSLLDEIAYSFIVHFRRSVCKNNFHLDDYCMVGMEHFVKKITSKNHFDIAVVNYVYFSKLFLYCNVKTKLLFTHDIFLLNSKRSGFSTYTLTPNDESKGLQRSDVILAIQENEAVLFHYLAPGIPVYAVFSPFEYTDQPLVNNSDILFFSGYNHDNILGLDNFIKNIFPLINASCSSARLLIGGSICSHIETENLSKNIILCGKFDSPADFYCKGDIAINPVYKGSGLKIKTFEALSYGKTTIVHEHSSEGIYKKDESPLFITSDNQQFAQYVINALKDLQIRKEYKTKDKDYMQKYNMYIVNTYRSIVS